MAWADLARCQQSGCSLKAASMCQQTLMHALHICSRHCMHVTARPQFRHMEGYTHFEESVSLQMLTCMSEQAWGMNACGCMQMVGDCVKGSSPQMVGDCVKGSSPHQSMHVASSTRGKFEACTWRQGSINLVWGPSGGLKPPGGLP